MIKSKYWAITLICLLFYNCGPDHQEAVGAKIEMDEEEVTSLPWNKISFTAMDSFNSEAKNWKVAKDVYTDFANEKSWEVTTGKGILVNEMTEDENVGLFSTFEHNDLQIRFEYLMPKSSNSGIYFQGRYELQLSDSYDSKETSIATSGAIYERWDDKRPSGQEGYEGHPPIINTSKAPGLWQEMEVFFRAPKFDKDGIKIENAKFEYVRHNGIIVQENISLSGPTRGPLLEGEAELGPLVIQGDHGNVAFRNMEIKLYTQDSLQLSDLTYQYFEHPYDNIYPEFDTVEIIKSGAASFIDAKIAEEKENHYGLIFKGVLEVPVTGEYLFGTGIDDGGDLFIDDQLVVHNHKNPGFDWGYGSISLTEGSHLFELRFYDNVWNQTLDVFYEGPGISWKKLAGVPEQGDTERTKNERLKLVNLESPELIRSFVNHQGVKRTHCISVGSPQNVHYSYDLSSGALLKFWKGDFADVHNMWNGRGHEQTLLPLNASVETKGIEPFLPANEKSLKFEGYKLSEQGIPIFEYTAENNSWSDEIRPSNDGKGLIRSVIFSDPSEIAIAIAHGSKISLQPNDWYSIDGQYYLKATNAQISDNKLLIQADAKGIIQYELFW